MVRRVMYIVPVALLVNGAAASATEDPAAAAASRFLECLAGEGVLLEETEREALRTAAADAFGGSFGELNCTEAPGQCAGAIAAASCEELAAAWAPQVLPPEAPATEAPAWALTYVEALGGRVRSCYVEENSAPMPEADDAALAGWMAMVASQLGEMTAAMSCTVNEASLAGCTGAIVAQPCAALASSLDPEGAGAAVNEACAELFTCENRADAVDDIMREEHTMAE
jgi:hypothetical protein